jgi:hypothetical protein
MIYTKYRGNDVVPDMYAVEDDDIDNESGQIHLFDGKYSYLRALIFCYDNLITGKIVYCMTRTVQTVVNGEPIKRGRKKKTERTDFVGAGFHAQIPIAPKAIQQIHEF